MAPKAKKKQRRRSPRRPRSRRRSPRPRSASRRRTLRTWSSRLKLTASTPCCCAALASDLDQTERQMMSAGAGGGVHGRRFQHPGRSKHGNKVEWTSKDLLKALEEFVPIYETHPIKNNMCGMGFDHSFGLWFMTRWPKLELMFESGAFKGHSTWVLRKAMPETPIISISPCHPEKYLKKGPAYVDGNCTYFAGKDFVDFRSMDWKKTLSQIRRSGIIRRGLRPYLAMELRKLEVVTQLDV